MVFLVEEVFWNMKLNVFTLLKEKLDILGNTLISREELNEKIGTTLISVGKYETTSSYLSLA